MKHLIAILVIVVPLISEAQVERVISPNQALTEEEAVEEDTNNTILQSIATQESISSSTSEETIEASSTESTSSAAQQEDEQAQDDSQAALEDYVGELNTQYQEAQEQCTTGSWLGNLWCKIVNFFRLC